MSASFFVKSLEVASGGFPEPFRHVLGIVELEVAEKDRHHTVVICALWAIFRQIRAGSRGMVLAVLKITRTSLA
jgi:hypothetical protein